MAAAQIDQVAETAAVRQPSTSQNSAAGSTLTSTAISHTPVPDQPEQTSSHGQDKAALETEPRTLQEGVSGEQAEAQRPADESISSEQRGSRRVEDPTDTDQETDHRSNSQATARGQAGEEEAREEGLQRASSRSPTGPSLADPSHAETNLAGGGSETGLGTSLSQADQAFSSASDGNTVRPVRTPLAAVQEGSAPMLGSLSLKPTSSQKGRDEGTKAFAATPRNFIARAQGRTAHCKLTTITALIMYVLPRINVALCDNLIALHLVI